MQKKDRARVFGDLFDTVFSDDLVPSNLLTPLHVLGKISSYKKDVQRRLRNDDMVRSDELFIIDGAYHVLFAVKRICVRDGVGEFSEAAIDKVDEAIEVIKACIEANKGDTFSFNRFFKDSGTRTKIETMVMAGHQ